MNKKTKNSGIPWIGEIPESWNVSKVKDAFVRKNVKAHQENPIVLSLARSGVKVRDISNNEGQIAESYFDYNPVDVDDLLINPMDLYSGANCSISKVKGVISPAYVNLRHKENVCPRYYDYYFKTQYWAMAFFAHGKGISFDNRWTLGIDTLFNYYIPSPSYEEQNAIADFLDKKCDEIDKMIAIQEKFIEELKAYKQSVITEAVTKGLNPNVPMKDSGIEWIGAIPSTWNKSTLKYLITKIESGVSVNAEQIAAEGEEYGVLKTSSVSSNHFISTENKRVDKEEYHRVSCPVKADTIIVSRMNTPELVGAAGYCSCDIPNIFLPDRLWQVNFNKSKIFVKYIWYYLISKPIKAYYSSFSSGTSSSMQNISQPQFCNAQVTLPRLEEQKEIADYLDKKCSEIDKLVSIKQQKIEELKDYRKSLIYEYVTGKKQVV